MPMTVLLPVRRKRRRSGVHPCFFSIQMDWRSFVTY